MVLTFSVQLDSMLRTDRHMDSILSAGDQSSGKRGLSYWLIKEIINNWMALVHCRFIIIVWTLRNTTMIQF